MKFDMSKIAKLAALGVVAGAGVASQADAALVINEVYAGGSNTGAIYNADFVELINNGTTAVALPGGSLQYGASTGYFATNTFTNISLPAINLLPGQTFLIGGAAGTGTFATNGIPLVNVDLASSLNAGTAGGKIRLLDTAGTILDLVGYGAATATPTSAPTGTNVGFTGAGFEGTSPAATSGIPNSLSITRLLGVDSNNNAADFVTAAPTPSGNTVPEPATLGLAAVAGSLLVRRRAR